MADMQYVVSLRIHVDRPLPDTVLGEIGSMVDGIETDVGDLLANHYPVARVFAVEAHGPEAVA